MAANSRAKATDWAMGDVPTPTQFTTMDTNGAGAIARASTAGGWKTMPLVYVGSENGATAMYNDIGYPAFDAEAKKHFFSIIGLPVGHTFTAIRVYLLPAGAHGGEVQVKPNIALYKLTPGTGGWSELGTDAYSWVSIGDYEGGVLLSVTGLTETVDTVTNYVLAVESESGTNSLDGLKLYGFDCQITVDTSYAGPDFTFWT